MDENDGYSGFPFGFGRMRRVYRETFSAQYRAFPLSILTGGSYTSANYGGKIFLPSSALDRLSRLNIEYPMLFSITNTTNNKKSNAGVLEFTAEEGHVYLPDWLMKSLGLRTRDFVTVTNVSLKLGTFVKIQPQSTDFLDISDHRAVLENALRNFSTLTEGDIFTISYNNKLYDILVLETKPSKEGISIVETDLQVDFEAPPGYVEPSYTKNATGGSSMGSAGNQKQALGSGQQSLGKSVGNSQDSFHSAYMATEIEKIEKEQREKLMEKTHSSGYGTSGARLTGNKNSSKSYGLESIENNMKLTDVEEKVPVPLDLPIGQLYFGFKIKNESSEKQNGEVDTKDKTFEGQGQSLRPQRKRGNK
ncbi:hypothetical protein BB559_003165 [Furculomyces boomerangus]|uniref:Ubiquitin fusion degradation protein 1 n=2 Tax=Harpellales TaxID=61421 RepID=A0A2T9YN86_9FUNG|nr:hypothetical protein BB559_003165 [Furculomyces boomerangus]PVZ99858.1 hypothetical protein BB558_004107 [Smittium angustum]